MNKKMIFSLIAALYAMEVSARAAAVKDAAKENNVAESDLFKALKEAGYKPKAEKGTEAPVFTEAPDGGSQPENGAASSGADADNPSATDNDTIPPASETKEETVSVTLRHKTEYPKYRRAGLVLSKKAEAYEVTASQLAALKSDKWVEVTEKEGGKKK